MKPLSNEQKLALRNKVKAELTRLNSVKSDKKVKQMIDDFKEKFTICEIVYKVIREEWENNKSGKRPERMLIDMREVPATLNYAGYNFEKELLRKLFGGETRIGRRSVKKLRDALTHSMNDKAITELKARYVELNGYMDSFLNAIDVFDLAA